MSGDDIDIAVDWAAAEGWNPGLHDAQCFFQTDPDGFFIAEISDEPVGVVSAVAYDETFGFGGFFIVKEEFRKGGIGAALVSRVMEHMGNRNMGLDGVLAQQENYKKNLGAHLAYRNFRYQLDEFKGDSNGTGIVPVSKISFDQVVDYDALCFPARREGFLQLWLAMPDAFTLASTDNGGLKGYGMIRACKSGWKIGPLFADDLVTADQIFCALCSKTDTGPIFLDIPEVNSGAVALVEKFGMTMVFETARMYTKGDPDVDMNRVFGVTSFELG